MSCPTDCPVSDADPFDPAILTQPYELYEELREMGGAVWLSRYECYALSRYEPVKRCLRDWRGFSSARGAGLQDFAKDKAWRKPSVLLETDPPLHTRTRGVLTAIMSVGRLRQLRDSFRPHAEALVGELIERGEFDAVPDLAEAFPLRVIPDAIGLERDGRENLLPFSNMQFNSFGPDNALFRESVAQCEPIVAWIEGQLQREKLQPGSIGAAIWEARDEGKVDDYEAATLLRAFLIAGLDTTINGMTSAIHAFARNPEQWQLLRESPALVPKAFDEAIRWESPVQAFFRTTTDPQEADGVELAAGAKVAMFLGSANRDPRKWDEPARFDLSRNSGGHVAFGHGIHTCIGQMLARLEAELILEALAARVERIDLTGEPVQRLNNTLRGLDQLPVRIVAA